MTVPLWPVRRLTPADVAVNKSVRSIEGPPALSGISQVTISDAGIWKIEFISVRVKTRDQVLAWRAIDGLLDGRANPILVPILDQSRAPWPSVAGELVTGYSNIPFSDGATFLDEAGFSMDAIEAILDADAAARATTVSIMIVNGAAIEAGQHFSIGERLYRIKRVTGETSGSPGTIYDVQIWPTLREAASEGDDLNFDDPICRCRLASDDAMDLTLRQWKFGDPSVAFVEDW